MTQRIPLRFESPHVTGSFTLGQMSGEPPKARDAETSSTGNSTSAPEVDRRTYAMLLSGLVLTPDHGLALFRDRRVGDSKLDLERIRRARGILESLGAALGGGDEAAWTRIDSAWRALQPSHAPTESKATSPSLATDVDVKETPPAPSPMAEAVSPEPVAIPPAPTLPSPMAAPLPSGGASPWTRAHAPIAVAASAPTPAPAMAIPMPAALAVSISAPASAPPRRTAEMPAFSEEALAKSSREPLPFASTPSGRRPSPRSESVEGPRATPFDRVPKGAAEAVDVLGDEDVLADTGAGSQRSPVAADPPLPTHLASLDVERFAALCAQCAVYPAWQAQILERFGIAGPSELAVLDAHWRKRLAADSELDAAWRWHYARHEAWARQGR